MKKKAPRTIRNIIIGLLFVIFVICIIFWRAIIVSSNNASEQVTYENHKWFLLHRKSNKEYFYKGTPGDVSKSKLLKVFSVKSGIPKERPTPLPQLLGKKYWLIVDKALTDNPETAPYFLTLDIPIADTEPFGPTPYAECDGQCNWVIPGYFGLHGVNGDTTRLLPSNSGSSGCIRHADADITYLYTVLDPAKEEIRYYIEDI